MGTKLPAVNIKESENAYDLELAIPGVKKEDIKVDLSDNVLTISSESKSEKEEKDGEKMTRKEFNYSSFKRSFSLPENVKTDDVSAEYVNGLLKMSLQKTKPSAIENKKHIEVK